LKSTAFTSNTCVAYLSFGDAQKAGNGNYWAQVIPYNGVWPTTAGPGVSVGANNASLVYEDYTPIIYGKYPFWAYEVILYPISGTPAGGITLSQLGTSTTAGTFLGVLNYQSGNVNPPFLPGSIEATLYQSEQNTGGAGNPNGWPNLAIRLPVMHAQRAAVGGILAP
jgi:hypothetical protein